MSEQAEHRFLCDAMLGKLCRWIRFLGFDSIYAGVEMKDAEIAKMAEREGRWLLTMDRELASRGPRSLLIETQDLETQLVELFRRLRISATAIHSGTRCGLCNGLLSVVEKDAVASKVPPHVLETVDRFRKCDGCGRIYWHGSHSEKIQRRLKRVFTKLNRNLH